MVVVVILYSQQLGRVRLIHRDVLKALLLQHLPLPDTLVQGVVCSSIPQRVPVTGTPSKRTRTHWHWHW
jgi:hypothetical protein